MQHGAARREQLLAAGVGRGAIEHRLKTQRFRLLHRGVYLIDPAGADEWTPTMAAVLLFGGDALASKRAAAAAWGMLDRIPAEPEVTVVGRSAHPLPGVRIHRAMALDPRDVRRRCDLPLTSPARTVVDLAGVLGSLELESALAACLHKRLASLREIREASMRVPRSPGATTLRHLLDQDGVARTRSHYERRLLELIAGAGLPRPLTNWKVAGCEVDMLWQDKRLILEFDGFRYHGDRRAFERDRRRDQNLVAAGYRVIRVTARQLEQEPYAVIARLATALAV